MCAPRPPGTAGGPPWGLRPPWGGPAAAAFQACLGHVTRRPYSTTFTIGCVLSVRYSSSSCSRLVAVTVNVRPR